jgi:hypothetical protein
VPPIMRCELHTLQGTGRCGNARDVNGLMHCRPAGSPRSSTTPVQRPYPTVSAHNVQALARQVSYSGPGRHEAVVDPSLVRATERGIALGKGAALSPA